MENVCYCSALGDAFAEIESFPFVAGAGKSVFWYVKPFDFPRLGIYRVV
jgi:hypothetical protein